MHQIRNFKLIDKESPIPFYVQIRDTIRSSIKQGQLKPGELIPGESDLCEYFDVSRTVIRQALDNLHHEGLIVRKKGKGTFIREPKIFERFGQEITGFHQEMTSMNYQIKTDVLVEDVVSADEDLAQYLSINIGDPLVYIKRLRYLEDEPILIVSSYYPYDKFGNLLDEDLASISLYELIEKQMGYELRSGRRSIEAAIADREQAKLLRINEGDPILLTNSIIYLEDGTPIEYYRSYHRGDRYRFEVELIKIKEGDRSDQFTLDKRTLPSSEGIIKQSNE